MYPTHNVAGGSIVSDSWEPGALGHDGEGVRPDAAACAEKSRVRSCLPFWHLVFCIVGYASIYLIWHWKLTHLVIDYSRHAEKYIRRGRLDWPEGATSRDSIRAVLKLPRLQVYCLGLSENFRDCWWYYKALLGYNSPNLLSFCLFQNLVMQHVDHSAGDLIDLLQGLLRYDPVERLTAREALRHPFFTRDHHRRS